MRSTCERQSSRDHQRDTDPKHQSFTKNKHMRGAHQREHTNTPSINPCTGEAFTVEVFTVKVHRLCLARTGAGECESHVLPMVHTPLTSFRSQLQCGSSDDAPIVSPANVLQTRLTVTDKADHHAHPHNHRDCHHCRHRPASCMYDLGFLSTCSLVQQLKPKLLLRLGAHGQRVSLKKPSSASVRGQEMLPEASDFAQR